MVVKEAAAIVEKTGGIFIESITDNHKLNQQFCNLFNRSSDFQAVHPLGERRVLYL